MPGSLSRRDVLAGAGALAAGAWLPDGPIAWAAPGVLPAVLEEDGYDLWLRYRPIADAPVLAEYRRTLTEVVAHETDEVVSSARDDLVRGLEGLLDQPVPTSRWPSRDGAVVIGRSTSPLVRQVLARDQISVGPEGYAIRSARVRGRRAIVIAGETGRGVLYGIFAFLRRLQLHLPVHSLSVSEEPVNRLRLLNHWDNLDRTIERGYAGPSIFHWDDLPEVRPRYTDYARALASIGVNGTVVNSVNASPQFLAAEMIAGLAALADVLRRHGVTIYLSANFASPISLGGLSTADPFDPAVQRWWRDKAAEIYGAIPDFGGFLVKADSEGEPGPLSYGRTHADGANMLADALSPHGGIVMWRTFVWGIEDSSNPTPGDDVAGDAHDAFAELDGAFAPNVVLQTKWGPIDFQVREPFHPLFGALPNTNSMMEVQITQEYTGGSASVCYLAPIWKEALDADTFARGSGSTVASVADGTLHGYTWSGMAGVANIGDDRNWTGHHFAAANLYAYGRLAWRPSLSAEEIADEWVRMTFGHDGDVVRTTNSMLLSSRRIFEDYTSPLGIGKLNRGGAPGSGQRIYPDLVGREWYHRADHEGVGFDRTVATGSGFTAQYHEPVASRFESLAQCPEELLLFFHHVPYTYELQDIAPGKTVIQYIYDTHFDGAEAVRARLREPWLALRGKTDVGRHQEVLDRLDQQVELADTWRDAVVWYFFEKSGIFDQHDRLGVRAGLVDGPALLVAGQATAIDLAVTSAVSRDVELRVELDPSSGWSSSPVTRLLASGERAEIAFEVTAAQDVEPGTRQVTFLMSEVDGPLQQRATVSVLTTAAGDRAELALDAGTATSPVLEAYGRLSPDDAWDGATGYGWVGEPPAGRDRGTSDVLLRDFVLSTDEKVLRVAVPLGHHRTFCLAGDSSFGSGATVISADGELLAEIAGQSRGEFAWLPFDLDGGDAGRNVDLHISGTGSNWRLNALVLL